MKQRLLTSLVLSATILLPLSLCAQPEEDRSILLNGISLTVNEISEQRFCPEEDIEMQLQLGNYTYTQVEWHFGDGTSELSDALTHHTYTSPGWYDVQVTAEYTDGLGVSQSESVQVSFLVKKADSITVEVTTQCLTLEQQQDSIALMGQEAFDQLLKEGRATVLNPDAACYEDKQLSYLFYVKETEESRETIVGKDHATGYNGKTYYETTEVVDTLANAQGCQHYLKYTVEVLACLQLEMEQTDDLQTCLGETMPITYHKSQGEIAGQAVFYVNEIAGYRKTFAIDNTNGTDLIMEVPANDITAPGQYSGRIAMKDKHCGDSISFPVRFTVYYPEDIFAYRFNNVLAVFKPGTGGNPGFTFTAYQWYHNGQPIPGATESIYHSETPLPVGDTYAVELTDENGMKLLSCPQTIYEKEAFQQKTEAASPAEKMLMNSRFVIRREGNTYNIYGQKE